MSLSDRERAEGFLAVVVPVVATLEKRTSGDCERAEYVQPASLDLERVAATAI
jgi:hypothetical protein